MVSKDVPITNYDYFTSNILKIMVLPFNLFYLLLSRVPAKLIPSNSLNFNSIITSCVIVATKSLWVLVDWFCIKYYTFSQVIWELKLVICDDKQVICDNIGIGGSICDHVQVICEGLKLDRSICDGTLVICENETRSFATVNRSFKNLYGKFWNLRPYTGHLRQWTKSFATIHRSYAKRGKN